MTVPQSAFDMMRTAKSERRTPLLLLPIITKRIYLKRPRSYGLITLLIWVATHCWD